MKYLLSIAMVFSFVSCSGSKSLPEEDSNSGIELADALEFSEGSEDTVAQSVPESMKDEPVFAESEPVLADSMQDSFVQQAPVAEAPVTIDDIGTYTVKENETLMMIAFHLYGDYSRWREISRLNSDKLNGSTKIKKGMELSYNVPAEPFVFNPSGNPYLIKDGDTLGKVSVKTYGEPKHWQAIWENNKPLIKDPNIIFAGFTIYTPMIEGRDVAFESL